MVSSRMGNWLRVGLIAAAIAGDGDAVGDERQPDQWKSARKELVRLVAEGVRDRRVLDALAATERHLFVPESQQSLAYFDMSLPIGDGVTISPPYVVAFMTEQLDPRPTDKVLEIGTGSGYQAALLSPLVGEVYSIEILEDLGQQAAERLKRLGYENVYVKVGDGFRGWPEHAPFDKIIVTCSPESIPQPLIDQLKEGGTMLIPLGKRYQQSLCLVKKTDGQLTRRELEATFFVPMTGHAEQVRQAREDDGQPKLVNGGFEEATARDTPAGWYYFRQATRVIQEDAPEGQAYLQFENQTTGRSAQALQAFGLDGQRFRELEISVSAKPDNVLLPEEGTFSGIDVRFYDANRNRLGSAHFGPWIGSSAWSEHSTRFLVPREAKLAMIRLGLIGATGELAFDNLRIEARETVSGRPF